MKVLVIGSGAREHALCWKIAQSKKVSKIYAAPGNGGISELAECVDIKADDIFSLLKFAKEKKIDLTVVGPETPLALGIVDIFKDKGLRIFGPDKYIAQLEASKVFAKETMARLGVPTADFKIFSNVLKAKEYIEDIDIPVVIKADGLAAGKGVIVAVSKDQARSAIDNIMVEKEFGSSGDKIIIEDCLVGEEASIILVADGKEYICLASSQDHKRVFDNDKGPNTGGMGAYSPAPVVTDDIQRKVAAKIIAPIIKGLSKEGTPYKGVLYVGIMIVDNEPYVLEFNVRFGDPETQAILPRMQTDIIDIIEASIDGHIKDINIEWSNKKSVCVVCASGGYPGSYKKGIPIYGLEKASKMKDAVVFHAGTRLTQFPLSPRLQRAGTVHSSQYETDGGRVLGVTALGEDIEKAIEKVYKACSVIKFDGIHYRKDIGYRAIDKVKSNPESRGIQAGAVPS